MVCAPVRSLIPSLKLGDYLSVQAHKPCSISHLLLFSLLLDMFNPNTLEILHSNMFNPITLEILLSFRHFECSRVDRGASSV